MTRKLFIIIFLCLNIVICHAEIEVRRDQPKIGIKLFKTDDLKDSIADFPISNDTKKEINEILDYFKNTEKFNKSNATLPKIILLYGDLKNGDKWQLSRLIAKEIQYSMIRIFPFELLESNTSLNYILKDLDDAGPCVLYIDKFDELVKKSSSDSKFSFQLSTTIEILKQLPILLVCSMSDFTNLMIKELAGPGIVKEILISYPDLESRENILKYFTKDLKLNNDVNLKKLAMLTYGFASNDLFDLVNETNIMALKNDKEIISLRDFDLTLEKLKFGKTININNIDRNVTAYHEAGHALTKILLEKNFDPFYKVTISARGSHLGMTCCLNDESQIKSKDDLASILQIFLAGIVSEKLIFNNVFLGNQNDLKKVTNLATKMICNFGMSDALIPMIYNVKDKNIKNEVQNLIKNAYENVHKLLSENRNKLERIANLLLEKETLYAPELYEILEISKKNDL